jgi:hypothetical protein
MATTIKFDNLAEEALTILGKSEISKNAQLALKVISEGKETSKVTKSAMVELVNLLLELHEWKKEKTQGPIQDQSNANIANTSSATVPTDSDHCNDGAEEDKGGKKKDETRICRFYKSGKCSHGKNGRGIVNGQTCPYLHPTKVCIQSKKFGKCSLKACQFMHMNVCRAYMKSPSSCKFGEKCRYFHPKQVKTDQRRENHTPANNAAKVSQTKRMEEESAAFLGQTQKVLMQALDMMSNMMAKMQASEGMSNNNRAWNNDPFLHK